MGNWENAEDFRRETMSSLGCVYVLRSIPEKLVRVGCRVGV